MPSRKDWKTRFSSRVTTYSALLAFGLNILGPLPKTYAQILPELGLPNPGMMIGPSLAFVPVILRGIKVHPDNPFQFDFIVDTGTESFPHPDPLLKGEGNPVLSIFERESVINFSSPQRGEDSGEGELKEESTKLIKYFLASLTVPEDDLWVNLSPYEKDRIIPEAFGQTEMGRDLLAQDYILKQLTASLLYPENDLGKEFWDKVYAKAKALYGTSEIPINTFNKVWIVPDKAEVYETEDTAFVTEAHLKVMLEGDYVALQNNFNKEEIGTDQLASNDVEQLSDVSSQIVKEIILPEIEKEVNEGKNFAQLRQIYNSLILAAWFKRALKDSILNKVYTDQNKIVGVNIEDPGAKDKIYQQYLAAFKKGVYDYIKEDYDPASQEIIPRRYFSGGFDGLAIGDTLKRHPVKTSDQAALGKLREKILALVTGTVLFLKVKFANATVPPGTSEAVKGWALKDLGIHGENPAGEIPESILRHWEEKAGYEDVRSMEIKGENIRCKLLGVDKMPEGMHAYHFDDKQGNLVIVGYNFLGVGTGSLEEEAIYHEAREAYWIDALTHEFRQSMPSGASIPAEQNNIIKRNAHILAAAEESVAFGEHNFTPYHQRQLAVMSSEKLTQLRDEAREEHDALTARYLPNGIVEKYKAYESKFLKKIEEKLASPDYGMMVSKLEDFVGILREEFDIVLGDIFLREDRMSRDEYAFNDFVRSDYPNIEGYLQRLISRLRNADPVWRKIIRGSRVEIKREMLSHKGIASSESKHIQFPLYSKEQYEDNFDGRKLRERTELTTSEGGTFSGEEWTFFHEIAHLADPNHREPVTELFDKQGIKRFRESLVYHNVIDENEQLPKGLLKKAFQQGILRNYYGMDDDFPPGALPELQRGDGELGELGEIVGTIHKNKIYHVIKKDVQIITSYALNGGIQEFWAESFTAYLLDPALLEQKDPVMFSLMQHVIRKDESNPENRGDAAALGTETAKQHPDAQTSKRIPVATETDFTKGGIDVRGTEDVLKTKGQGVRFDVPSNFQNLDPNSFPGLTPVIFQMNVIPIQQLPAMFLGVKKEEQKEDLSLLENPE